MLYNTKSARQRIDLSDVSFLIPVRIDSESRLKNLYIITSYLDKYFNTSIHIAESDLESKVDKCQLPDQCHYTFLQDHNKFLHHTGINNRLVKAAKTKIVAIYDTDVVFPIGQIIASVNEIRTGNADYVSPYDGTFIGVSDQFKNMFSATLDPELLVANAASFQVTTYRSFGGATFLDRKTFLSAGMDNEYFTSWGPEDIERPKRMKNLGYRVKRISGPLFHLPHERNINSIYPNISYYIHFMEEYLKITGMDKEALEAYISTWPWTIKQ